MKYITLEALLVNSKCIIFTYIEIKNNPIMF